MTLLRTVAAPLLLLWMIILGACDFSLLESPEMPRWGVSLTIPLINKSFLMDNIADSVVIFESPDTNKEIQIEFADTLQKTSISSEYLFIELGQSESVTQSADAPDGSAFSDAVDESFTVVLALDSLLAAAGMDISFPADSAVPIPQDTWNDLVNTVSLDQEAGPFQVLDTASLASAVTFIKQVRYVQLLADPGVSEFATSVINDFPTAIDSVSIELFSLDPAADTLLYESHDTTGLGSGDTYADTTDLASGKLGASLSMVIGLALPTADTTVTVLADTDPKIEITIGLVVGGVDSLAITTAQSAMDLDVSPPPVELPEDIQIIRGLLKDTVMVDPVNEVSLSGLRNRLPFDIDLQIIFPNFSSDSLGSDSLVFGPYLLVNGAPDTADVKDLGGHWFLDPGGEAIDQFEIIVKAVIQEKDVIIPLDGLPMGEFRVTFDVEDMQFAKIEGNFLISFDTVPTSIADIPTGFDGFLFDRLSLELRLYNQIKLPVNLALQLVGKNDRGDSVVVPILAPVNYPGAKSWSGDPAYTVVVLNENSVSTYWLAEGDTTYDQDDLHAVVANEGQSIVDVLNMAPDTLEVGGAALIQGKGQVDLGASVWGTFELIAPFAFILPQPVTFLPVDATPIDTMDSSTRGQIEMALLSSSLTSQITTNFPIGGSVSMLISDSTLFPIFFDQLDQLVAQVPETVYTTYDTTIYDNLNSALLADSITGISHIVYYPEETQAGQVTLRTGNRARRIEFFSNPGDNQPAFWVGRMFDMELPPPATVDEQGYVTEPGDTTQVSLLDAERARWITSEKPLYLKPLITFYKTNGARTLQSTNSIDFAAYITFELSSDIFVPPPEGDTTKITVGAVSARTVTVGNTVSVNLGNVFTHSDGVTTVNDLELVHSSNHTGIADVDVRPDSLRTTQLAIVTGIGVGSAQITITADDDPEDYIDPVELKFYVTVAEDTSAALSLGKGLPEKSAHQGKPYWRREP